MLSTPAPIPISIIPVLMALAISTQACKPLEHCLFKLCTPADSGNPAASAAARNSVAPPPGASTVPTAISSTSSGFMPDLFIRCSNTPTSRSAAAVSLNPPLPPFVSAVRKAQVTTICHRISGSYEVRKRKTHVIGVLGEYGIFPTPYVCFG